MSVRCRRRLRRATTLIEVLLGLVILSTLLAGVAIARGRFLRQWADADRRIEQVRRADALMSTWLSGPAEAVPLAGVGGDERVSWRTRTIPSAAERTLGAVVVRLDVFDRANASAPPVTLDVLVHDARFATTQAAVAR